jgi:DNA-directed RNA polymerase beta' subunit
MMSELAPRFKSMTLETDDTPKRYLTPTEIENILSFIVPNANLPEDTGQTIVEMDKNRFRRQLRKQCLYPELIPSLREHMERAYFATRIEPGECVGVICAQSIGQDQTQRTLDAFHKTGISEKATTEAVPRCEELMSATKNPKQVSSKVYFKTEARRGLRPLRKEIGNTIVGLTFADLAVTKNAHVHKEKQPWYEQFKILHNADFESYEACISMQLDIDKLFMYKLTMAQIAATVLEEYSDIAIVYSPPSIGILDIFFDLTDIEIPVERQRFVGSDSEAIIYLEECVMPALDKLNICGIPNIGEMYFTQENDEWLIETHGGNLSGLLAHPNVDETRTVSSNAWDIYRVLGIEAVRQFLIEEFGAVMEGINSCHPILLVDRMTYGGVIASISRFTLKNEDAGPIGKASFEESMTNLQDAGARGGVEPANGVSASIICGKLARMGTGLPTILIDLDRLPDELTENLTENLSENPTEIRKLPPVILENEEFIEF